MIFVPDLCTITVAALAVAYLVNDDELQPHIEIVQQRQAWIRIRCHPSTRHRLTLPHPEVPDSLLDLWSEVEHEP
jgi:hypothetical protein